MLKLNNNQIEYILYHLNHHLEINDQLRRCLIFGESQEILTKKIIFPLSDQKFKKARWIDTLPILFPISSEETFYHIDKAQNLIFHDDLLKSAFYLLSGHQETIDFKGDEYARFSFMDSIQKELNIVKIPLVNAYFKVIIDGLEQFCVLHKIPFRKKKIWSTYEFGFMLTHDVDRVDKHTIHEVKLRLKQLFNVNSQKASFKEKFKSLIVTAVKLFMHENPYWNFDWMRNIERKYGFISTWFFLPKGQKHLDAYYSFKEPRIKNLVRMISKSGSDLGLHGTYHSRSDKNRMLHDFNSVKQLLGKSPLCARQHWLSFKYPDTLRIMEDIGLKCDSSWGFPDHVGWRNSYCHPFRPYDLEKDRMMEIWEFPLCLMDCTLMEYQGLNLEESMKEVVQIIDTVSTYNGLFVLLWHNSYFDEVKHPGVTDFYLRILELIHSKNPKSVTPKEYISKYTVQE